MERYLEGEEISHEEIVTALKDGTNHGGIFPVVCGVATRNLGTNRLLDAIVEDLPSTGQARRAGARREVTLEPDRRQASCSPTSSRRGPTRSPGASTSSASTRASMKPRHPGAQHPRARQGARRPAARASRARRPSTSDEFGPGDIGAVAKLKETRAGDWLAARDEPIADAGDQAARAGHGVRDRAQGQGRRGQGVHARCAACRRRTRRSTCTATRRPASRSSPACRRSTSRSSSTA